MVDFPFETQKSLSNLWHVGCYVICYMDDISTDMGPERGT